jgi:diguanylate cyclase (GGDEF)-like protein
MPSPGDPLFSSMPSEDPFLELVAETLEGLDRGARAQFLQRFFKNIAQLELSETRSLELWEQILNRRRELADSLGKSVSLKRAMVDVWASSSFLRVPVLIEYEELKKLEINAATDPLTGLYNRRFFEEHFEKELNRASRYTHNLALVVIDLHRFKEVNDGYGHSRGDLALQAVANTLRKSLRTSDYAFRTGGDEFALLLVQSDSAQAQALARRVRANFAAAIAPMQMTVSLAIDFGVAVYPADGDQKEILIHVADERLYEMKDSLRAGGPESATPPDGSEPPSLPPANPVAIPPVPTPTQTQTQPAAPRGTPAHAPSTPEKRKWERVSLGGTHAYAQFAEAPQRNARVLALSYGGVAFETAPSEELAATFYAVLHVPILPPVRVSLKKLYQIRTKGGQIRVGCAFVT